MIRPCMDCEEPMHVRDHDELAICLTCVQERRNAEARALADSEQAGAQHLGRERETRDVRRPRGPR